MFIKFQLIRFYLLFMLCPETTEGLIDSRFHVLVSNVRFFCCYGSSVSLLLGAKFQLSAIRPEIASECTG